MVCIGLKRGRERKRDKERERTKFHSEENFLFLKTGFVRHVVQHSSSLHESRELLKIRQ